MNQHIPTMCECICAHAYCARYALRVHTYVYSVRVCYIHIYVYDYIHIYACREGYVYTYSTHVRGSYIVPLELETGPSSDIVDPVEEAVAVWRWQYAVPCLLCSVPLSCFVLFAVVFYGTAIVKVIVVVMILATVKAKVMVVIPVVVIVIVMVE